MDNAHFRCAALLHVLASVSPPQTPLNTKSCIGPKSFALAMMGLASRKAHRYLVTPWPKVVFFEAIV